jgi:hypothetical protein
VLELVRAVREDLARGRVERDGQLLAGLVPGRADPVHQRFQRGLVGREVGREAALVAHRGAEPAVVQGPLEGVEGLRSHAQGVGEGRRAHRHDHELLEVHLVVGMGAPVEDVHHRHGQHVGGLAAEVAPERHVQLGRRGLGGGQRHAEDRVRPQPALVGRAVQVDHRPVEARLVGRVEAGHRTGQLAVDVGHGVRDGLAAPGIAAVAQLDRLELACRGAARHRGPAGGARGEDHVDLDRGIAAAVEDLAGVDLLDLAHGRGMLVGCGVRKRGDRRRWDTRPHATRGGTHGEESWMNRNREWLVPLTGVAFIVVAIVSFMVGGEPPDADEPVREIVDFYVDDKDSIQAGALIGVGATLLLVFFGAYLRKVLQAAGPEAEMLSLVSFVGLVVVGVGFAIDTTILFALSEAADDIDPVGVQALQALWDNDFVPIMLGLLLFLWGTGLAVVRTGVLPKWLGWLMILLGIIGLTPIGFVAFLGSAIILLVLSILLSVRARSAPAPG